MEYSVLMSVYVKENAEFFSAAVESMLYQSCPPTQFVLVCDGPLTPALDKVIDGFTSTYPDLFRILRLPVNQGLALLCKRDCLRVTANWWPVWTQTILRCPCGWSTSWRL